MQRAVTRAARELSMLMSHTRPLPDVRCGKYKLASRFVSVTAVTQAAGGGRVLFGNDFFQRFEID